MVLEYYKRRLYSSFSNASTFWDYYSEFKGKRCFYWINRSYELPKEMSLLHLDIEWYTSTRDVQGAAKILSIREAIISALPLPVGIFEEDLSLGTCTGKYKNSFHLYPVQTLSHYYDGLAEQPSDIRWLRGPRTSQIELQRMTTTHFKPPILVNIRYYVMISGKNFIQQGAAVL